MTAMAKPVASKRKERRDATPIAFHTGFPLIVKTITFSVRSATTAYDSRIGNHRQLFDKASGKMGAIHPWAHMYGNDHRLFVEGVNRENSYCATGRDAGRCCGTIRDIR